MKRTIASALALTAVAAVAAVSGPAAWAGESAEGGTKKVERRIVIRHGGGGFLGVGLDDLEGDARGAKVRSVEADSPAEKGGLQKGDVIVRFDGEAVRSAAHLARLVGETPPGRAVAIEVTRSGATQKLSATVGEGKATHPFGGGPAGDFRFELPELPHGQGVPHGPGAFRWRFDGDEGGPFRFLTGGRPRLGVSFAEVGEQLAAYLKLPSGSRGVLVTEVSGDSPAEKAGIKAGDVVQELDGHAVEDGGDLRQAVAGADAGKDVVVKVVRDGRPLSLHVSFPERQKKKVEVEPGVEL